MHISDFDYDLPADLIAQTPLEQRDASRMLVLDREKEEWTDSHFSQFTRHLRPSDVVVVNNSRVIPARLIGRREETGGQVEIFLVREKRELRGASLVEGRETPDSVRAVADHLAAEALHQFVERDRHA